MRKTCWRMMLALALLALAVGCSNSETEGLTSGPWTDPPDAPEPGTLKWQTDRIFPTEEQPGVSFAGCMFASPQLYEDGDSKLIIVAESGGTIAAIHPDTGEQVWSILMPTNAGLDPFVIATPIRVEHRLVVAYHTTPTDEGKESGSNSHGVGDYRSSHHVAVVDLNTHKLDPAFPVLELKATLKTKDGSGDVTFLPNHALGRSDLVHGIPPGSTLGNVYVTFGNARDIQPWHGWAFEINLDTWRAEGAEKGTASVLVTTPESDCGPSGVTGSTSRLCGGGLWAPSGPLIVPDGDSYTVILAPGNGLLDLARDDYANTMMKVKPGMDFSPECDELACQNFDPDDPAVDCMESCKSLFIPRLLPGQPSPKPADGTCDGLAFFPCWEEMDYIGGSSPTLVELKDGPRALIYPTKDGHIYVVDYDHMGTLFDRVEAAPICGTANDQCIWFWAGMIITQPTLTQVNDEPVVLVPTFMPDQSQEAGIRTYAVRNEDGKAKLHELWRFPLAGTAEAEQRFRRHPSRMRVGTHGDPATKIAWIFETASPGGIGRLLGLKLDNGARLIDRPLHGPGYRFTLPLLIDDRIYLNTCDSDNGKSYLEGYSVSYSDGE